MEIAGKFMLDYKPWLIACKTSFSWFNVFVSHAGFSRLWQNENDLESPFSILWNRGEVKRLHQVQVFGHTPHSLRGPMWIEESNAWNIDSGAYKGNGLSAIRLNKKGEMLNSFFVDTAASDKIESIE